MKNWIKVFGLTVIAVFFVFAPVWADSPSNDGRTDGHVSERLAQGMYCDVGGLLEGDIGLLIGLILVFIGIWSMVQGAKIAAVLPVIVIGSLVTALPSLIESTFSGLGELLIQANISKKQFSPPKCDATETITVAEGVKEIDASDRPIDTGNHSPVGYGTIKHGTTDTLPGKSADDSF